MKRRRRSRTLARWWLWWTIDEFGDRERKRRNNIMRWRWSKDTRHEKGEWKTECRQKKMWIAGHWNNGTQDGGRDRKDGMTCTACCGRSSVRTTAANDRISYSIFLAIIVDFRGIYNNADEEGGLGWETTSSSVRKLVALGRDLRLKKSGLNQPTMTTTEELKRNSKL